MAPVTSVLDLAPSGDAAAAVGPVGVHRHGPLRVGPPLPDLRAVERADPGRHRRPVGRVHLLHRHRRLALRRRVPGPVLPARVGEASRRPGRQPGQRTGHSPTSAPILVVQGTADEVVPFAQTTRFIGRQLCHNQYDTVDYVADRGLGHDQALDQSTAFVNRWLQARFAGVPRRLLPPARARDRQVPLTHRDRSIRRCRRAAVRRPRDRARRRRPASGAGAQTSRKRRTANADPTTPTPMPTTETSRQVPKTSQPLKRHLGDDAARVGRRGGLVQPDPPVEGEHDQHGHAGPRADPGSSLRP